MPLTIDEVCKILADNLVGGEEICEEMSYDALQSAICNKICEWPCARPQCWRRWLEWKVENEAD